MQCRTQGEPVLYVNNPAGIDRERRRMTLDAIRDLNLMEHEQSADPDTLARIGQYELAFRMQTAVPEVMDIADGARERARRRTAPSRARFRSRTIACWRGG